MTINVIKKQNKQQNEQIQNSQTYKKEEEESRTKTEDMKNKNS